MFDAVNQQWLPVYAANGLSAPMSQGDESGRTVQENAWGDLGYSGDPNDTMASGGRNDRFLRDLGYTGPSPFSVGQGDGSESGRGMESGYDPAFIQFLQSKGITLQQRADGQDGAVLQAFGPDGQPMGDGMRAKLNPDNAFGAAMAAAGLFGAGAAGAFGAGTMGAPAAGTSSAATYTAATPMVGGVSEGLGVSGMDMAADAGMAAWGGGGGAAAGAGGGATMQAGGAGGLLGNSGGLFGSGITGSQALNFGGSLLNAGIGAYTGNKALDKQTDATNASNALWEPYRQFGTENLGRANGLLKDPSSINKDPQHQFLLNQGMQARDRSAAARGGLYSGAQMKGAERFGQDLGNTSFDRILGRYTGAAQLGATGTTNISNNLTNLGQAGAGAAMYQGNVANNAFNNALGQYNFSQYFKPS
jgi:hypothetical protein